MAVCGLRGVEFRRQLFINAYHCHFDDVGRRPLHSGIDCLPFSLLNITILNKLTSLLT